MRYEFLDRPAFAVARVSLEPGEAVRAESGAMVSMTPSVTMESKSGGLGSMFGRLLAGESLFQTTFTATSGPGEVWLAPAAPGDIEAVDLAPGAMMVTSGCFLACDPSIELKTVASGRALFSGEGMFLMRASGPGTILVTSFGAIRSLQLGPGQPFIVDSGHLVGFSDGMGYQLRKAARSLIGTVTSGEGIVVELTGPGSVLLQTRTPRGFAGWLGGLLPRG